MSNLRKNLALSVSLLIAALVAAITVLPAVAERSCPDLLSSSNTGNTTISMMDELLQSYAANKKFMGTVIVARGKNIIFEKGYGFANLEWELPNTPYTKYRLASVSKQFTAAAVLLLEERGKLRIDEPVRKYVSDAPASWSKITIAHLLAHCSGIPTYDKFPDYVAFKKIRSSSKDLLKRITSRPLEFQPGKKYSYSNSGYLALGILIERVSGQSYAQFIQESIFKPLGMNDSGYGSVSAIIKHRASGYINGANGLENADLNDWSNSFSAGGLYSTAGDLFRWEQGLFGGKLLSDVSLKKMTLPYKQGYALGLEVREENGHRVIGHTGTVDGFDNVLAYYPDSKLCVVVLGNKNGPEAAEIASKLAAISHGEKILERKGNSGSLRRN